MKKKFSTKWKKSRQPRKQRKYRHRAPLHIKGKFLTMHLSKDLAKKQGLKRIRVRVGDKVKVMRGKFKGREGKVEMLDLKKSKVVITGIEVSKKDGSKSKPPIHASNLLITELNLDDKKRLKKKTVSKKEARSKEKVKKSQKSKISGKLETTSQTEDEKKKEEVRNEKEYVKAKV